MIKIYYIIFSSEKIHNIVNLLHLKRVQKQHPQIKAQAFFEPPTKFLSYRSGM